MKISLFFLNYHFDAATLEVLARGLVEVVRVLEERFRGDAANVQAGTAQSGALFNANSFETELSRLKVKNKASRRFQNFQKIKKKTHFDGGNITARACPDNGQVSVDRCSSTAKNSTEFV